MEQQLTRADVEKIFLELVKSRLYEVVEQFVEEYKEKLKDLPIFGRLVHSEEERKSFCLRLEKAFTGINTEMNTKQSSGKSKDNGSSI